MCLLVLFVLYGVIVNCLLKSFALSVSVMAVLVRNQMVFFCCVGAILLIVSYDAPKKVRIVFVINFVKIFCQDVVSCSCIFCLYGCYK